MRLKNFLLVVEDMERAKSFYKELFGLDVMRDFDTNVILTQGLVLQERKSWEQAVGEPVSYGGKDTVLYFEEYDLHKVVKELKVKFQVRHEKIMQKKFQHNQLQFQLY